MKNPVLDLNKPVFAIGSCFAVNVFEKLQNLGIQGTVNPLGTVFNPWSIAQSLEKMALQQPLQAEEILHLDYGKCTSIFHSHFFIFDTIEKLQSHWKQITEDTINHITKVEVAFITVGSAHVYEIAQPKLIVSNCHKLPAKNFTKRLLELSEIEKAIEKIIGILLSINPTIKIMWSISPVKYLRDGIIENLHSKSRLLVALHQVISTRNNNAIFYIPAYEVLSEELRDHRFYAADLAHPSEQAVQYIFEKWIAAFATSDAKNMLDKLSAFYRLKNHRVMDEKAVAMHEQELEKQRNLLLEQYPFVCI